MSDLLSVNPGVVEVWFPNLICQQPGAGNFTVLDQPPSDGIDAGTGKKVIHETCVAFFQTGREAEPLNLAALQSLAQQIAADYYSWHQTTFDTVYGGAIPWTPNALVDEIVWTYTSSDSSTRVMSAPFDGEPEEYQHTDCSACGKVTWVTAIRCVGSNPHPTVTQVDVTLDADGKVEAVSAPYTSTATCCDCPTATCSIPVTVGGCMVAYTTCYTGEGNYSYSCPYETPNTDITATVNLTGGGVDLTQTTSGNQTTFTVPVLPGTTTYTVTVTAPGYLSATQTFTVTGCVISPVHIGGVYVLLVASSYTLVAYVTRCDYPGAAPGMDDGSGTVVTVSGSGSGTGTTNSYGYVILDIPVSSNAFDPSALVVTGAGPSPYYATSDPAINTASYGSCVGIVGIQVPLTDDYICCLSAVDQECCLEGFGNLPISYIPKVRPFKKTLNATIGGSPFTISSAGGCGYETCVVINGLCCQVSLYAQNQGSYPYALEFGFSVTFLSADAANEHGQFWTQGVCQVVVDGEVVSTYSPCDGATPCSCNPGDVPGPWDDTGYVTIYIPLSDEYGPGWEPLNCTGNFDGTGYPPGSPLAGPATLTE